MKFNNEDRVFIKPLGCKGVIKEQNQEFSKPYQYKCTYFVGEERKVEWFKEDELDIFKKSKSLDEIKFAKVKSNAIIPSKTVENAGMDVYACFDENYMWIKPHETVMIPTCIASACSPDYYFQLLERGSTGTKGIGQRCGVIDSGYRDAWFVPITNHNNKHLIIIKKDVSKSEILEELFGTTRSSNFDNFIFYPYSKAICQVVLLPVPKVIIKEIPYDELKNIPSERGIAKLGDSGK